MATPCKQEGAIAALQTTQGQIKEDVSHVEEVVYGDDANNKGIIRRMDQIFIWLRILTIIMVFDSATGVLVNLLNVSPGIATKIGLVLAKLLGA
jgi:hypothetical protein